MVNKLTKKAILSIKKNIEMYNEEMSKFKEKMDTIDEKYRQMAEEAKKELTASYENLKAEQEIWEMSLSRYDADVVNEVLGGGDSSTTEETEESFVNEPVQAVTEESEKVEFTESTTEEEKIVDTIFEENNKEQVEVVFAEEKPAIAVDPDGSPVINEDVFEAPVDEQITEEVQEQADKAQENEWPDFPAEW